MLGSKKKKDINEIDTQSECHTSEANKYSTQSGTTGVLGTSAAGICMECKHIFLPFLTATNPGITRRRHGGCGATAY